MGTSLSNTLRATTLLEQVAGGGVMQVEDVLHVALHGHAEHPGSSGEGGWLLEEVLDSVQCGEKEVQGGDVQVLEGLRETCL